MLDMRTENWDGPSDYEPDPEPYEPPDCPACGGWLELLGALGRRYHFRCSDCGMDSSAEECSAGGCSKPARHHDHHDFCAGDDACVCM